MDNGLNIAYKSRGDRTLDRRMHAQLGAEKQFGTLLEPRKLVRVVLLDLLVHQDKDQWPEQSDHKHIPTDVLKSERERVGRRCGHVDREEDDL